MKLSEKINHFISRLRQLPETKKKIIFFTVVVFACIVLGSFGIMMTKKNLAAVAGSLKTLKIPDIGTPPPLDLQMMPELDRTVSHMQELFDSPPDDTAEGEEGFEGFIESPPAYQMEFDQQKP